MDLEYARYLLAKNIEDYEILAKDFSRTRQKVWKEMDFLFEDYLVPGERVLDLGCGNGRWFPLFQEKKVDYIGIDNSEELIEIAKDKYPQGRFQKADALSLPFSNNSFDKVYSIAVLHHIPSREFRLQFLKEVKRVLKPEGTLVLTVWRFHQKEELLLLFKYTILKILGKSKLDFKDIFEPWGKRIDRYYHCFSKKELLNLVKEADFKIIKVSLVKNERGNRQNIYLLAKPS
jgi:ubiquinone/menaquinone biosynthesis C-methylase UbiE